MNPVFSIIIPHRNIPDLLTRCLDSIPRRDDIQVIVVDDNSDPKIVDFGRFPGLGCPNVEVYFDKTGLGAGHARNVGLDHAKGEWLIFSDADDFFSDLCNELLEKYKDASEDVIYFNMKAVMSDDIKKKSNRSGYADIIQYMNMESKEIIRYMHVAPWSKMIKRSLVVENCIKFKEYRWSNDIFFSVNCGIKAHTIEIVPKVLYIVTERSGSLMSEKEKSIDELECRAKAGVEAYGIAHSAGFEDSLILCEGWILMLYAKKNIFIFLKEVYALQKHSRQAVNQVFVHLVRGKNNWERLFLKIILLSLRLLSFSRI